VGCQFLTSRERIFVAKGLRRMECSWSLLRMRPNVCPRDSRVKRQPLFSGFVTSSPRETGQEIDLRPEASRLEDHAMSDIRLWLKNHPTSTNGLEAHYAREHSSTFR
jgi:hypothetical protein